MDWLYVGVACIGIASGGVVCVGIANVGWSIWGMVYVENGLCGDGLYVGLALGGSMLWVQICRGMDYVGNVCQ